MAQRSDLDVAETRINLDSTEESDGDGLDTDSSKLRTFSDSKRERYTISGKLGAGGMATVFDAVDSDLRRHVAVKRLHEEHATRDSQDSEGRSPAQRFIEEAQITGQLEHPNIVPVHEIGHDENGNLFFTMKRVEGRSLGQIFDDIRAGDEATLEKYDAFTLCEIFLKICNALDFAHSRYVIHRDLKPDNIMIGQFGEVQLMDWGLAKVMNAEAVESAKKTFTGVVSTDAGQALHTMDGTISGTPAYMPPEQARGETARIDHRSDIFLLGAMLYEAITLVPPFHADSSLSALRRAQNHDLPSPHEAVEKLEREGELPDGDKVHPKSIQRAKAIPPDLAAIAMHALQEHPEDRYQSVREMADDVERFIKGQVVSVYEEPFCRRAKRWIDNHMVFSVALVSVLVVGLAAGFAIMTLVSFNTKLEKENQERNSNLIAYQKQTAEERAETERRRMEEFQRRDTSKNLLGKATGLLWRASMMEDPGPRQKTLEKALVHADEAIAADPTFPVSHTWKGNILFDLGRTEEALPALLEGITQAEEQNLSNTPDLFMTPAMILITHAVTFDLDSSLWAPQFVELMNKAAASAPKDHAYYHLATTLAENIATVAELGKTKPGSEQETIALETLHKIANRVTNLRLEAEEANGERLWEIYLFSAWHVTEGWGTFPAREGESDTDRKIRRYQRGIELVDMALKLRPNLPLAVELKSFLVAEKDKQEALKAGTLGTIELKELLANAQRLKIDYLTRFPYDVIARYNVARTMTACGMGACPITQQSPESILMGVIDTSPSMEWPRVMLGKVYEMKGDENAAREIYQSVLQHWKGADEKLPQGATVTFSGTSNHIWQTPLAQVLDFEMRSASGRYTAAQHIIDEVVKVTGKDSAHHHYYHRAAIQSALTLPQDPRAEARIRGFLEAIAPTSPQPIAMLEYARFLALRGASSGAVRDLIQQAEGTVQSDPEVRKMAQGLRRMLIGIDAPAGAETEESYAHQLVEYRNAQGDSGSDVDNAAAKEKLLAFAQNIPHYLTSEELVQSLSFVRSLPQLKATTPATPKVAGEREQALMQLLGILQKRDPAAFGSVLRADTEMKKMVELFARIPEHDARAN